VISLDCLRADRLSCYGNPVRTSAFLDSLARAGARFSRATAPANWTLPSHSSLFTGTYLFRHGVLRVSHRIPEASPHPIELLRQAGFRTAAFTGGGYVHAVYGYDRGFEVFESFRQLHGKWPELLAKSESWLAAHRNEDSFLFLHTYEVHEPFTPPEAYVRRLLPAPRTAVNGEIAQLRELQQRGPTPLEIAEVVAHYDADILYTDELLGAWYRRLAAAGLTENLLLIVSSDHGEQFWEHGHHGHGHNFLGPELTDIPLIVRLPDAAAEGRRGRVIDQPASFLDLFPTVLDAAGLTPPWPMDGVSRLPEVMDRPVPEHDRRARELRTAGIGGHRVPLSICEGLQFLAVDAGGWRALLPRPATAGKTLRQQPALYDLTADPGMQRPLAMRGAVADSLRAALARLVAGGGSALTPEPVELTDEAREQLRALGYTN
jgi:arylsulfatase A-like enzyme